MNGDGNALIRIVAAEMQVLPFNFLLYATSGIWRPIEWSSMGFKLLYSLYTVLMVYVMLFLMVTQFLDIVLVVDNVEDFTTNFLFFTSVISAICKVATALTRRSRIVNLIEILQQPPCRVCNQEEMDIQAKFDRSIRLVRFARIVMCKEEICCINEIDNSITGVNLFDSIAILNL